MASQSFGPYKSGAAYATALGINNLGLQLNTPANNQQSAQRVGTYNANQAGSNNNPLIGVLGASTVNYPTSQPGPGQNGYVNPNTGGGGGGSAPTPYFDQGTGQTFGSYGDFTGAIDSAYNDAYNILSQNEQSIRSGENDLYTQATAPYDAQRPQLDQALAEGQQQVATAQQGVRKDEANALSEARRLYQELAQAGVQRFGGSTSAGEFANQLLGREFQRNVGKAYETSGQNMQKLVEKGIQIKQSYDTQVQALDTQKNAALAQARDVFRQRLDQINNARLGLSENKAQLKLQELQNLRNTALAISQQYEQFKQQVYLQSQAADLNLRNALSQYRSTAMTPAALDNFGNSTYSNYGNNAGTTNTGVYQGGLPTQKKTYTNGFSLA